MLVSISKSLKIEASLNNWSSKNTKATEPPVAHAICFGSYSLIYRNASHSKNKENIKERLSTRQAVRKMESVPDICRNIKTKA